MTPDEITKAFTDDLHLYENWPDYDQENIMRSFNKIIRPRLEAADSVMERMLLIADLLDARAQYGTAKEIRRLVKAYRASGGTTDDAG
jgi:hypothetical protein